MDHASSPYLKQKLKEQLHLTDVIPDPTDTLEHPGAGILHIFRYLNKIANTVIIVFISSFRVREEMIKDAFRYQCITSKLGKFGGDTAQTIP